MKLETIDGRPFGIRKHGGFIWRLYDGPGGTRATYTSWPRLPLRFSEEEVDMLLKRRPHLGQKYKVE